MKFTESHEWVQINGDIATVGISQHAQKELGEVVYAELPRLGSVVKAQDEVAVLESTKAAVDIYSPLSGEIIEINHKLQVTPQIINQASESEGWLYRIRIANFDECKALMDELFYRNYTKTT